MTVIDASAAAAVAFLEPEADAVRRSLEGEDLAAPHLLLFELSNIARTKIRRRPDAAKVLAEQLRGALALPIALHEVNHIDVLALASALDLTTYDASYLWLARRLGARLVTLDRELNAATRRA